jgi:putative PEP-CTERM system histidine kinase
MLIFAVESLFTGMTFLARSPERVAFWQLLSLTTQSFLPGVWLCFSLSYSRANPRDFLLQWRSVLLLAFAVPLLLLPALFRSSSHIVSCEAVAGDWSIRFGGPAKIVNALVLISATLVLMNLERTFRSAVGTMRWRIKFLFLGLAVIFGSTIYTSSQALLYSGFGLAQSNVQVSSLLIGCILIAVAYLRSGFAEIDVYPSRTVLQTSITLLLAGSYLFVVGVLAQIVARFGGAASFQAAALFVLLGISVLAVLLLSDRIRQNIQLFVSRNFQRPQHDFRQIWTGFTRSTSAILDESDLCKAASRLISETFNALSVSIWLFDEQRERLVRKSSTSDSEQLEIACSSESGRIQTSGDAGKVLPFDLERTKEQWAQHLKVVAASRFPNGGNRICIPLLSAERWLGAVVLADRVSGIKYTAEEMDLLKCIGDQVAAGLLNLRLTRTLVERKELEAFQAISAFFVHDLKNAAATLGLMLQNLPEHFGNPAFREDALRGIGTIVDRINQLIGRMSALRHELRLKPVLVDLNQVVTKTLKTLNGTLPADILTNLQPLSPTIADQEQLESVVTNLLLNASDAAGEEGRITVETGQSDNWIILSVADNGCGMTPEFIRESLFRPFRTTKKKGLGIGMFQLRMIINAHSGKVQVTSEPGVGTTFRITLPLKSHME